MLAYIVKIGGTDLKPIVLEVELNEMRLGLVVGEELQTITLV